jgi:hypothetical protein
MVDDDAADADAKGDDDLGSGTVLLLWMFGLGVVLVWGCNVDGCGTDCVTCKGADKDGGAAGLNVVSGMGCDKGSVCAGLDCIVLDFETGDDVDVDVDADEAVGKLAFAVTLAFIPTLTFMLALVCTPWWIDGDATLRNGPEGFLAPAALERDGGDDELGSGDDIIALVVWEGTCRLVDGWSELWRCVHFLDFTEDDGIYQKVPKNRRASMAYRYALYQQQ